MFKFIIDTDQYAGNFEREMCAYLTGRIGDCEVGKEFSSLFFKEEGYKDGFFDNITTVSDEDCYRPCSIEPSPKKPNKHLEHKSVAIFFESRPTQEQIELMKRRAQNFTAVKRSSNEIYTKAKIKSLGKQGIGIPESAFFTIESDQVKSMLKALVEELNKTLGAK